MRLIIYIYILIYFYLNFKYENNFNEDKIISTHLKKILHLKTSCITNRSINQNININDCLISYYSSSEFGSVIYIDNSFSLSINDTTFYQCISQGWGGAIYFQYGLNIQLYKICAINCKAKSFQFAFFRTMYNSNQTIDLNIISKCNNPQGDTTLNLYYGNQIIINSNITFNENDSCSGINYDTPFQMKSYHCTFYNNSVRTFYCIFCEGSTGDISKINIILNNSPMNYGVVTIDGGLYSLNECIF